MPAMTALRHGSLALPALHTTVRHGPEISLHSGIVADSIPEREWEETLHKAAGLLAAWA